MKPADYEEVSGLFPPNADFNCQKCDMGRDYFKNEKLGTFLCTDGGCLKLLCWNCAIFTNKSKIISDMVKLPFTTKLLVKCKAMQKKQWSCYSMYMVDN